jgi:hypothetical protein
MYSPAFYGRTPTLVRPTTQQARIASVDIVRDAVMVLMALDHVRDWVTHVRFPPKDLARSSGPLFATRWVTAGRCSPTARSPAGRWASCLLSPRPEATMKLRLPMLGSAGHETGKLRVQTGRLISPTSRPRSCGAGILSLLLLLVPAQASADLITFRFTGTITILPLNPVPGIETAGIGDSVTGLIQFETDTPDSLPEPEFGRYDSAVRRFQMSVGNATLSLTGLTSGLAVEDAAGFPPFDLISFGAADPSNTFQLLAQFLDENDVIRGDAIPLDPDVYMRFATRRFRILHVPDFDVSPRGLAGTIDSVAIAATPVPEPGTVILLATGAATIGIRTVRRRKRT